MSWNNKMNWKWMLIFFFLLLPGVAGIYGQEDVVSKYLLEPAGDPNWVRYGFMNANRASLKFYNHTQLGDWPAADGSEWPLGSEIKMNDGIAMCVGARLLLDENQRVLEPARGLNAADTLFFCQSHYREHQDQDPNTGLIWGFWPVEGYLNPEFNSPAMSDDEMSWPVIPWPDRPEYVDTLGNVEWNGHFGRGKMNADLECYFVVNDALDQEFVSRYLPRSGKTIVDSSGNVMPWGGLGLRVGVRGFQWSNPLARDVIFWHYDCTNLSDDEIYEATLGFWVDNQIGGDSDDEIGIYLEPPVNMAYAFDRNGVGLNGERVGVFGIAYLESPGKPYDERDNDRDGIIDEKRDNDAGIWTENPLEGIYSSVYFTDFYKKEPAPHWTGDEDQDWISYEDANGNGVYDPGELINDDVGTDGVGPEDDNYYGPDLDGTEGNGRPDQGEPNFGRLDKDESDQVGLTAFRMFPVNDDPSSIWFVNDDLMWDVFTGGLHPNSSSGNLIECSASGPFPYKKGQIERISMAVVHAWDFPYVDVTNPYVPNLLTSKNTVQNIYNNDYQFAKPPTMPTLSAAADDGRIILSWDDVAESSRDPYLNYLNDFEGYKIYKSTEPYFSEPMVITDGQGNGLYRKPAAQFDKIDDYTGYAKHAVDGTSYYLGSNTGLKHYWIDENVQNGRTYYYAIVAYDFGFDEPYNLPPSENKIVLRIDEHGNVQKQGKNVAVITPRSKAAGFIPGDIELVEEGSRIGTGGILDYKIFNPIAIQEDHYYQVCFRVNRYSEDSEFSFQYDNTEFSIVDQTDNDTVLQWKPVQDTLETDIFDGIQLKLQMNQYLTWSDTLPGNGWLIGEAPLSLQEGIKKESIPWDYDIIFSEEPVYTIPDFLPSYRGKPVFINEKISFFAVNQNITDGNGVKDTADLLVVDEDENGVLNLDKDFIVIGESFERSNRIRFNDGFKVYFPVDTTLDIQEQLPQPGDILTLRQSRPFLESDSLMIHVQKNVQLDKNLAKDEMKKIQVVPNPYIVTNMMEPNVREGYNQQRKLLFNHLPAKCVIRIYTISGNLVRKLEVENPVGNGSFHWDLLNKEGAEVGFGVYLFHVDAPGAGEHVGKFAIIK